MKSYRVVFINHFNGLQGAHIEATNRKEAIAAAKREYSKEIISIIEEA